MAHIESGVYWNPSSELGSYTSTRRKEEVINLGDIRAKIEAVNKEFIEAFNRGDITAAVANYTVGARILPPNSEMIEGRQAIQSFWQGAKDMGVKEAKLETVEVMAMGEDMACEIGKYTLKIQPEGGETITDRGKYVVVWKYEDGSWKLDIDIWNTNLPATG